MKTTFLRLCLLIALLTVIFQASSLEQAVKPAQTSASTQQPPINLPAQYSATAFVQAGPAAGRSFGVNISISGLTSDGERDELLATLKHKGPDALLEAFEDMKDKGRVSPVAGTGTGMHVVRIHENPNGGAHIVLATNRWITFMEEWGSTRSRDYPFSLVIMDVDKNGKGSGTLAPACKVRFNKRNELEIETFGQKPLRLANVRREK